MENPIAYDDEYTVEELIEGQIVAMSPRPNINHNHTAGNIYNIFYNYLRGKSCTPFMDGTDLHLSEENCFVPDCMVVCDPEKIHSDGVYGAPDLVVEVLSPSTAAKDRGRKRAVYERCGVKEYWLVSPEAKSIEQYLLQEGRFELAGVYSVFPDYMLKKMKPEELAAVPSTFRCSLFEDLDIVIEDVFERVK